MSSNFIIPAKPRQVLVQVYDHDSVGPRYHDIPDQQLRVRVCQTTTLRSIADALARRSRRRNGTAWTAAKIVDRHGDEFVDPSETVWGALGLMPICIIKAAPSRSAVHRAQSSAWKATSWDDREDEILVAARQAGLTFPQIQARHFPARMASACQKRYQRLVTVKGANDRAGTGDAQPVSQEMSFAQVQPGPLRAPDRVPTFDNDGLSSAAPGSLFSGAQKREPTQGERTALTTDENGDESEDEPLLIPVPKATATSDAARIAATHNIINRKALEQHHRRRLRRESADITHQPPSEYNLVEKIKVEPEETTAQPRGENEELTEHPSRREHATNFPLRHTTADRSDQKHDSSASDGSQAQEVQASPPYQGVPSSQLDRTENSRHTTRMAFSLTPIKVRGKRRDKPKERSAGSNAELERSRQEGREHDATINANLRRAREEAQRQTSATRLERAERFIRSLLPPAADSLSGRSSSPAGTDSSPTVRVAEKRQVRTLMPVPQLSGSSASKSDSDTPSSPAVLGESETAQRRVHFDPRVGDDSSGHQVDGDMSGPCAPQDEGSDSLPASTPGASRELASNHLSSPSERTTSHITDMAAPVQQMAEAALLPKSHLASRRLCRPGPPRDTKQSLNHWAGGRHPSTSHGVGDRVSKGYDPKKKPAKKFPSRKPGF